MTEKLRVLDLFSGIGGFSLGLERAGMKTVAFCEIEEFPRKVLRKHWPEVPIYDDVRTLTAARLTADGIGVDVICGGFPCQDASVANVVGVGSIGKRTGLYAEQVRIAGELRCLLIMENVTGLLGRGFGDVLRSLAEVGFDAEWGCISARNVGADHERDRIWIVAYPSGERWKGFEPDYCLLERTIKTFSVNDDKTFNEWRSLVSGKHILRGVDGVSVAMERRRLKAIGNSVVPKIPELIGRAIMAKQQ
jgi:DNA (cytosine-5)-methyltransferase 1